jgi:CRISPR-associated protein Cas2
MIVIIVERAPTSLRGELTRWLLEPKAGVFVGRVSARVREKLWKRVCSKVKGGSCILIWRTNNEQGFQMDFWNDPTRHVTNWDGIQLITKPHKTDQLTQFS